jgi:hypothetical protein
LRNFKVLPPGGIAGAPTSSDAMVRNPATLHTVSFELLLAFQGRGYLADTAAADFSVAYYVAAHLPPDTSLFRYGYPYAPYTWWQDEPEALNPARPDSQGTIIVDVLNPKTNELLWRGEGTVKLTANQTVYVAALKKTVDNIVGQFQAGSGTGPTAPRPLQHGGRMR